MMGTPVHSGIASVQANHVRGAGAIGSSGNLDDHLLGYSPLTNTESQGSHAWPPILPGDPNAASAGSMLQSYGMPNSGLPASETTPTVVSNASAIPAGRGFSCPLLSCGRLFKRLEHLKRHVRTHTQERPYECTRCSKRFSRSDNLTQHVKTHDRADRGERLKTEASESTEDDIANYLEAEVEAMAAREQRLYTIADNAAHVRQTRGPPRGDIGTSVGGKSIRGNMLISSIDRARFIAVPALCSTDDIHHVLQPTSTHQRHQKWYNLDTATIPLFFLTPTRHYCWRSAEKTSLNDSSPSHAESSVGWTHRPNIELNSGKSSIPALYDQQRGFRSSGDYTLASSKLPKSDIFGSFRAAYSHRPCGQPRSRRWRGRLADHLRLLTSV